MLGQRGTYAVTKMKTALAKSMTRGKWLLGIAQVTLGSPLEFMGYVKILSFCILRGAHLFEDMIQKLHVS